MLGFVLALATGAAAESAGAVVAAMRGGVVGKGQVPSATVLADDDKHNDDKETTAPPPEEDEGPATTTPPSPEPESAQSILHHIAKEVKTQLDSNEHQWIPAGLAFVIGVVMLIEGDEVFRWLLVGAAFLLCCVLAESEISTVWQVGRHDAITRIVGIEAGLVGGYIALQGIDGVVVAVGAVFGAALGMGLQQQLSALNPDFKDNKGLVVAFYSLFIIAGTYLFKRKKHVRIIAAASALGGSLLVSSAISWAVTASALKFQWTASALPDATPKAGTWLDFVVFLVSRDGHDVGIFAGSKYNPSIMDHTWRTDRIVGVAFAVILFIVGFKVQINKLKSKVVEAREQDSLTEALLASA